MSPIRLGTSSSWTGSSATSVTGADFWRLVLALINALFFSLTAGTLISAISRGERRAWTATFAFIGLFVMVVWGGADLGARWPNRYRVPLPAAAAALPLGAALGLLSWLTVIPPSGEGGMGERLGVGRTGGDGRCRFFTRRSEWWGRYGGHEPLPHGRGTEMRRAAPSWSRHGGQAAVLKSGDTAPSRSRL